MLGTLTLRRDGCSLSRSVTHCPLWLLACARQEVIKEVRVEVPKVVHIPVEVIKEVPIEVIKYVDREVRRTQPASRVATASTCLHVVRRCVFADSQGGRERNH